MAEPAAEADRENLARLDAIVDVVRQAAAGLLGPEGPDGRDLAMALGVVAREALGAL